MTSHGLVTRPPTRAPNARDRSNRIESNRSIATDRDRARSIACVRPALVTARSSDDDVKRAIVDVVVVVVVVRARGGREDAARVQGDRDAAARGRLPIVDRARFGVERD